MHQKEVVVMINNIFFLGNLHFFFPEKKKGRKGQSHILMHAFAVAFSLIMIWIIASSMNSMIDDHREFVGKKEILQVCDIMKTAAEKIMVPQEYVSRSNTTLGSISIAMPEKIGGTNYRTRFVNDTLIIETTGTPTINDTCIMGFNATFRGGTNGGRTSVVYTRYSDGTDEIRVTNV
ncbi:MAG: hypothetical protein HY368_00655 [Candidatus Aenigmarchaeota archaeon]|nr:hypothetical protein [Candidatus Aenigmarchaeota archaeon]